VRSLGAPKRQSFEKRVDWLVKQGVFSAEEGELWHTLRHFRNGASHPTDQTILAPPQALTVLTRTAEMVDRLFG
jgi:hypothetical protein